MCLLSSSIVVATIAMMTAAAMIMYIVVGESLDGGSTTGSGVEVTIGEASDTDMAVPASLL